MAKSYEAALTCARTSAAPNWVRMKAMSARATSHVAPAVASPAVIAAPNPAAERAGSAGGTIWARAVFYTHVTLSTSIEE